MVAKVSLGERLTSLRNNRGLTQEQVSEAISVKRARYNSWENNIASPSIELLKTIANFFNVSTDYLLENQKDSYDDTDNILELLHKRPEMKILFSTTKNASKEDIEQAVKIIEALKKK